MIGAANEIYAQYFTHRPAKTGVGVNKLWGGALIEIEVVASRHNRNAAARGGISDVR